MSKLTATKVKALKEKGYYSDGNGLYLSIDINGNKNWVFRYTYLKKRSKMGLGFELTLSEARVKVIELNDRIKSGHHPKSETVKSGTFEQMSKEYIDMRKPEWKNKKHAQQWKNTLNAYAYPYIGSMQVADIATSHIKSLLDPIWLDKPETAKRVRSRVQKVIDYCIALGISDKGNPARLSVLKSVMPKHKRDVKHFPALHHSQISDFYSKLHTSMSHYALMFTILTASRTNEIIGAKWSDIDCDLWTIPKERMKSNREHRVPLSKQAVALLESLHRVNEFIFPSTSIKPKGLSNMAMLTAVKNINPNITVHGFRSCFRDWVEEATNYDSRLAEAALAHVVKDKTVAAYQRSDLLEKRRVLMQEWADYVTNH